ncbi:MAG TPA: SDR family oxidoreductase [Candidatus Binataceae bacterium]|nr:SDR family oxidoreductase [Candidatus Binataceae bacterium]
MARLDGKVVLVSGGGADGPPAPGEKVAIGNGRATAILCAREGASVMVTDRSLELAAQTAELIRAEGGAAEAMAADVLSEEDCRQSVAATVKRFGKLQLLVNNVGIVVGSDLLRTTAEQFDLMMATNVRGHFFTMKYAVPEMKAAGGGAIVNVSSAAAARGGGVTYGTSKAALNILTRSVAILHAKDAIRANTVMPAYIDSTINRRLVANRAPRAALQVPLKRQGTPWELAEAIVFLLSDQSSFITGVDLLVDGGALATYPL